MARLTCFILGKQKQNSLTKIRLSTKTIVYHWTESIIKLKTQIFFVSRGIITKMAVCLLSNRGSHYLESNCLPSFSLTQNTLQLRLVFTDPTTLKCFEAKKADFSAVSKTSQRWHQWNVRHTCSKCIYLIIITY